MTRCAHWITACTILALVWDGTRPDGNHSIWRTVNETFCLLAINGGLCIDLNTSWPILITNCTKPWIWHVHHVLWWTKQRLMWPKTWPDSKAIKPRPVGSVASCCVNCVQITWGHLSWPYLWNPPFKSNFARFVNAAQYHSFVVTKLLDIAHGLCLLT